MHGSWSHAFDRYRALTASADQPATKPAITHNSRPSGLLLEVAVQALVIALVIAGVLMLAL